MNSYDKHLEIKEKEASDKLKQSIKDKRKALKGNKIIQK